MHLFDLPIEILEKIAGCLDFESLLAFRVTHPRLHKISLRSLRTLKLKKITKSVIEFLSSNGHRVRHLDLSHCESPWSKIESVIVQCQHITKLNLVNSRFDSERCLKVFPALKKLETLHMTVLREINFRKVPSNAVSSIKTLYIEVEPTGFLLEDVVKFINLCSAIEVIHINLFGGNRGGALQDLPVSVDAGRWKTLRTVVCTSHLALVEECAGFILRSIFRHNSTPEISEWIEEDMLCYIYENGQFNDPLSDDTSVSANVELLKRYHFVDISDGEDIEDLFQSPWGAPKSVQVYGNIGTLPWPTKCSSRMLTELDISYCHGTFTEEFRLNLIASSPSLQVLSGPLCFFLPAEAVKSDAGGPRSPGNENFNAALRSLRLRKLFVEGACDCDDDECCKRCGSKTPLNSTELIDLGDLKFLEEFTFTKVNFESSVFTKLVNPNVRVARLSFNSIKNLAGVGEFVRRSENLQYLKLGGRDLDLESNELWAALDEGEKLKQLCIRSGYEGYRSHLSMELLKRCANSLKQECSFDCSRIVAILQRLEFMHLHTQDWSFGAKLHTSLKTKSHLRVKVIADYPEFLDMRRAETCMEPFSRGRGLCNTASHVGVVPPVGWAIE